MISEELHRIPDTPEEKRILNIGIAEAVMMFCHRYRVGHNILETELLTEKQIDDMLDGIRSVVYKAEGVKPKKK